MSKEQEVDEKSHHLKSALSEIENLKSELSRLRRYEDELNNVQVSQLLIILFFYDYFNFINDNVVLLFFFLNFNFSTK